MLYLIIITSIPLVITSSIHQYHYVQPIVWALKSELNFILLKVCTLPLSPESRIFLISFFHEQLNNDPPKYRKKMPTIKKKLPSILNYQQTHYFDNFCDLPVSY